MEAKTLLLPCNDYTKWVLDKVEEQLKMSRGAMSADMHRLYVAAACYYAGMDVKRTLPYAGRCRRSEECRKSYKEVVAPGFLRYLVETMEHSPPMALTVDLMGSTTLQGNNQLFDQGAKVLIRYETAVRVIPKVHNIFVRRYRERFGSATPSEQQVGHLMHELNQFCWELSDRSLIKSASKKNRAGVAPQVGVAPLGGGCPSAADLTPDAEEVSAIAAAAGVILNPAAAAASSNGTVAAAAGVTPHLTVAAESTGAVALAASATPHSTTETLGAGDVEGSIGGAPARRPMPDDFIDPHLLTVTLFGLLAGENAADGDISHEASESPPAREVKTEGGCLDGGSGTETPPVGSANSLTSAQGVTPSAGATDVASRRRPQQLTRAATHNDETNDLKRKIVHMSVESTSATKEILAELKELNHQVQRTANIEQHKAVMTELRAELQDAADDGDDAVVAEAKKNIKKQRKMFLEYMNSQPLANGGASTTFTAPDRLLRQP